jgi:hypothetical protein
MRVGIPDWQRALSAQAEILAYLTSAQGKWMCEAWLDSRYHDYGLNATTPSAAAFQHAVEDFLTIEPLYVSEEMQELTYQAMETFDTRESLHFDDLFMPSGFALLSNTFYTIDNTVKRLGWRAVSWRFVEQLFSVQESLEEFDASKAEMKQCLRMMLWSHIDDEDDYPLDVDDKELYKARGIRWGVAHATTIPLEFANDLNALSQDGDIRAMWMTFFRVLQRLMAEKIVVKDKRQVHRAAWREAGRISRGQLDLKTVRVIELRRRQQDDAEPTNGGPGNYSHQWIVKGFWRNQYYPKSGTHRQKYIADYVKGPKDKPLIVKKRVWVWDR